MKKQIITFLLTVLGMNLMHAQHDQTPAKRVCGTTLYHEYLKENRKGYEADFNQYNQMIEQYMASPQFAAMKTTANITIPVVIHIVYKTAAENISDAQAISQFAVLDNDFNRLNADSVNTPAVFRPVAGRSGIRFCLAKRDPAGNPTTGIEHIATTTNSFSTNDAVKSAATGGANAWDVSKYMNIWVCNLGTSILGYGEFPTGTLSNTYGLVLHYKYTGSGGSAVAPFNKGRTGTHEFGHCFNLRHIWGDNGQCGASDLCPDTPPQRGGTTAPAGCNYGVPAHPLNAGTCTRPDGIAGASVTNSNGDMFQNYMDYTDDAAMNIFTKDQCTRMLAVVSTAPWNVLQTSQACNTPTGLDAGATLVNTPAAGYSSCNNSITPVVTVANNGSVTLTSVNVLYKMDAAATQTLNWTGSLASGTSTVITLNSFTGLSAAAHTFSVWTSLPNGSTDQYTPNDGTSQTFTITAAPVGTGLPFTQNFETGTTPPAGWTILKANTIDPAVSWSVVANSTGLTAGSTRVARMDNYTSGSNITGQLDALRSPALTFTAANTSLSLTFDVSHKYYGGQYADTLNVYISQDCGGSWQKLYSKGGSTLTTAGTGTTAYTPTVNTQWRKETVSLSSYAGLSSVYLKFESRSGWGNYLYLDNINVSYTAAATPPVANFSTSVGSACTSSSVQLTDMSTNTPTTWTWTANSPTGVTFSNANSQNPSVTFANAGTYSITLSASNTGGTNAITKTITVLAKPTVAASNVTVCAGSSATLTASGASTYTWMPGVLSGATIVVTPTANTIYTITGNNGTCTNTKTVSLSISSNPTVTVNSPSICAGSSTMLTATGATAYSWTSGATTSTILVTPTVTTNYTVTGTTGLCSSARTATVTVNQLPVITASTSGTITCTTPTVNVVASGTMSATYNWTGTGIVSGVNTATAMVNQAGNFVVTAISPAGCTYSTSTTVNSNASLPNISVTPGASTLCSGTSTSLTGSSTTTPVSYLWSNGATTATILVTPTLTTVYTLTVTNTGNGCKSSASSTVNVNALPNVSVNSATICSGTSTVLTATGATTYSWNTGATTSTISVNPTSLTAYTVTGTTLGCSSTKTTSVSVNTTPTVSAGSNATLTCSSPTTALVGNGSASTYTWSGSGVASGVNTTTAVVNSVGVYSLVGTSNGCLSNTSTVSVSNSTGVPTLTVSPSTTICLGNSTNLVVNTSASNSILWSTSATTSTISVTPTVTTNYSVVVTNTVNGCQATGNVLVTVTTPPVANAGASKTLTCSNPTAVLNGSGVATYTWSGSGISSGANTANPTVFATGTYSLIGSTNGCVSNMATVTVVANTIAPTTAASVNGTITCLSPTISITASSTPTNVSYLWSGPTITSGNTSAGITVGSAGVYSYTITNPVNGCITTNSVSVSQNVTVPTLTVSASSPSICNGNSTSLFANSGTSSIVYNWMPGGATTSSISVTPTTSTQYSVTVTNTINGCATTKTIQVTVNNAPSITASSATICTGSSTTLTANGASTYTWSPAGSLSSSTGSMVTSFASSSTVYTVAGTSAQGCVGYTSSSVFVTNGPTVTVNNATICAGNTVTLSANGASTYSWNTGATSSSIAVSPTSMAAYTVVGYVGTCSNTKTVSVIVNATPTLAITSVTNVSCFGMCNGAFTTGVNGGSAPYSYSYSPSGSSINLCASNYSVLVTDASGCKANTTVSITQPTQMNATTSYTDATCGTCADGSNDVMVTGGIGAYTYSWMPINTTTPSNTNLLPGCYTVTVSDANNCQVSQTTCIGFGTKITELVNDNSYAIYPNPTANVFNVKVDASYLENTRVEVYDAMGKLVAKEQLISKVTSISLEGYAEGIYTVKLLSTNHNPSVIKVLKN